MSRDGVLTDSFSFVISFKLASFVIMLLQSPMKMNATSEAYNSFSCASDYIFGIHQMQYLRGCLWKKIPTTPMHQPSYKIHNWILPQLYEWMDSTNMPSFHWCNDRTIVFPRYCWMKINFFTTTKCKTKMLFMVVLYTVPLWYCLVQQLMYFWNWP